MDRPLDDFADIVRGITFAKSEGSASPNDGLLPVIRAGSIQSELLVEKDQIWIPRENIRDHQLIRKDDIVMCASSGSPDLVGKCAKAEFDWEGSFGAFCVGIRPKKEICDPSFLYHFLSSPRFRNWSKDSAGANIKNIRASELAKFPVPDVPVPEQKRIAAILDRADAIRRKRQQAIALADEFLRSVFLDMFGDPLTNPKGWDMKRFGELGEWSSGGTPARKNPDFFKGNINWYSARELNTRYLSGSIEKITEEALNNSAAKMFPAGSMLVGMYDTAAFKISIINEASSSNQACANIIPNDLIDIEWFYSFIEISKETFLRQRRGVRQQNLNLGMIKEFEMPLPPKALQNDFVSIVRKLIAVKSKQKCSEELPLFESISQKAFADEL